nr:Bd3614 family nucleic acid deaminase [Nannocystis sp. SCPEA4]
MMAAFALVECRVRKRSMDGHNIGAILVTNGGQVLSWGLNQYNVNHTFHAEVNTLQSYWKRTGAAVPDGSVLFTTLKPCKMCAGMIQHAGVRRTYMGQDDPGSHATNTDLDVRGADRLFAVSAPHKPVQVYKSPVYSADREARPPPNTRT